MKRRTAATIIVLVASAVLAMTLSAATGHPDWGMSEREIKKAWNLSEDAGTLLAGRKTPGIFERFTGSYDSDGGLWAWRASMTFRDPVDRAKAVEMLISVLDEKYGESDESDGVWTDGNGDGIRLYQAEYIESRRIGSPMAWTVTVEWTDAGSESARQMEAEMRRAYIESV